MTDTLVICNERSPLPHTNDCPRRKGHDGEHLCWTEGRLRGSERRGVTVKTWQGDEIYHLLRGESGATQEEVGTLLALFERAGDS